MPTFKVGAEVIVTAPASHYYGLKGTVEAISKHLDQPTKSRLAEVRIDAKITASIPLAWLDVTAEQGDLFA